MTIAEGTQFGPTAFSRGSGKVAWERCIAPWILARREVALKLVSESYLGVGSGSASPQAHRARTTRLGMVRPIRAPTSPMNAFCARRVPQPR